MLKKFLSTFIAVFTLITVVATSVYADFSITDFYPQTEELYSGKFDDGEIDTTHMVITDNDTTPDTTPEFDVYEDTTTGELVIDAFETYTGSKTVAVWPSGYDASSATGTNTEIEDNLVISFDISRYAASGKVLQIGYGLYGSGDARSGPYLQWKDSDLTLTDHDNSSLNIHSNLTLATDDADNYHNFAFVLDSSCVASLYIDGVLVRENIIQRDASLRGKVITNFNFYFSNHALYTSQSVKLKNFKIYTATEAGIVKDFDGLEISELTSETADASGNYVLTQNLNLPTIGDGNGTITWSSSNEAIISSDGTIHRHSGYEKSDAVTLTAKIVNGEIEVSKDFTFYVKRKDFATTADMDGDYIVYDDFSNSNLKGRDLGASENGEYVIARASSGSSAAMIYFEPEQSPLASNTNYVVEYDAVYGDETNSRVDMMANTSTGKRSIRIWRKKGVLSQEGVSTSNTAAKNMSGASVVTTGEKTHFKYLINTANGTFSLYVNGALLVKDAYRTSTSGWQTGLGGMQVEPSKNSTITFDNLKVYKLADNATFAPESSSKTIILNGDNVTQLRESGTYTARLNITDYATKYTDDTDFVAAIYNKNTKELESVKVVSAQVLKATVVSTEADECYGLYAKTTVEVPQDYENYYIKLMHWNGSYPMSTSVTVE